MVKAFLSPFDSLLLWSFEQRVESRESTAAERRKGEVFSTGSPFSFLLSTALLPRSGNGGGLMDSQPGSVLVPGV